MRSAVASRRLGARKFATHGVLYGWQDCRRMPVYKCPCIRRPRPSEAGVARMPRRMDLHNMAVLDNDGVDRQRQQVVVSAMQQTLQIRQGSEVQSHHRNDRVPLPRAPALIQASPPDRGRCAPACRCATLCPQRYCVGRWHSASASRLKAARHGGGFQWLAAASDTHII